MYEEIMKILGLSSADTSYEPKKWADVEKAEILLTELIGDEGKAKEIIGLAMVGELSIVKLMYP